MAVLLFEFYQSYKDKLLPTFFKISAMLLVAGLIGVLPTISNLIVTNEYGKQTTRGKSELTITADANSDKSNETDALDADYIKQYSLGYGEAWSLVIPNVKGGRMGYLGNYEDAMSKVPAKYQKTVSQQYSYWGEQYSSGGAFYFGASIFLLFLLSIFFVKDRIKWAMLAVSALAILLSWKYNPLVDWFIDYVPLFSKFRDTKMMLILVQVSFPLLGFLFLNKLLKNGIDKKMFLYISAGAGALFLLFYAFPGVFFDFQSNAEIQNYTNQLLKYANDPGTIIQIEEINHEIVAARKVIFREDVLRSLLFILATSALIYLFMLKKLKQTAFLALLAVVIIADLWTVDKRYLNNDKKGSQYFHWVDSYQYKNPFQATVADAGILNNEVSLIPKLKLKINTELTNLQKGRKMSTTEFNIEKEKILFRELNFATNYRVFSLKDPFSNSRTSYYHKSIGGYHGAKLKKYQELIEFYISKEYALLANYANNMETITKGMELPNFPIPVLNMLNTKYIIADPGSPPILNPYCYGNAWFVDNIKFAANADEEILLLNSMNKNTAILNEKYKAQIPKNLHSDSSAHIQLTSYRPNQLTYESSTVQDQLAVFSEIYYNDGWNAYLDGEKTEYFKANYLLRAMNIPAGKHTIEFKFEPESYYLGKWLSNLGSVLIILYVGVLLFFGIKQYVGINF